MRLVLLLLTFSAATSVVAQELSPINGETAAEAPAEDAGEEREVNVAKEVQIDPVNSDERIARRLTEIMQATGWFVDSQVVVDRGVVFLSGQADSEKHQEWAEATAMNTSDVVAVVNQLDVAERPFWNFSPAITSLKELGREFTGMLPLLLVAVVVGILSYYAAIVGARASRWLAADRIDSKLLRQVAGNVIAVLIFIVGMYVALRVSGLTRLAVTLLGGTGLVGLALGFAFRDIAENYLASILISLNHPFRVGDLIEVEGAKGFVRKVTTRGTVLNTLEGNQIQMPNSTVYKGKITNFTATPLSRQDFGVGIGFDDSTTEAQETVMRVLGDHAAVVDDPAPLVIVDSLGAATVNLRVLYWFDQTKHSPLKVSSSVIRLVTQRLTEAGITMPDEARELIFPQGVPVKMLQESASPSAIGGDVRNDFTSPRHAAQELESDSEVNAGEGDLSSEQDDVMRVTAEDESVDHGANLIG